MDYAGLRELAAAGPPAWAGARQRYEAALAARLGAARVFALSSGRGALHLALQAAGVGPGDEVAIPALTCPAVADAVLALGAVPHLVDVSPRHFGVDPHSLRRVLARRRTRAAVVAPLFGGVPPQDEAAELFASYGVPWVEDVAQAFGSTRAGKPAGTAAPLATISTNFDKPFTTGRGGALVVNDAAYIENAARLAGELEPQTDAEAEVVLKGLAIGDRLMDVVSYRPFVSVDLGFLYAAARGDAYALVDLCGEEAAAEAVREALAARDQLMPERRPSFPARLVRWFFPRSAVPRLEATRVLAPLLAEVGFLHLAAVDAEGERRRALARVLDDALADEGAARGPSWGGPDDSPWPIRYPAFLRDPGRRDEVVRRLAAEGYEAGPFIYPRPISGQFPYYKLARHTGKYLRGAWRAAAALVNLPLHAGVGEEDARRMAAALR